MTATISQPWLRFLALIGFVVWTLIPGCEMIDEVDAKLKADLQAAFSGLDARTDELERVVDQERVRFAQDTQTLVNTTTLNLRALVEQARDAVELAMTDGANIEENAAADLRGLIGDLTESTESLARAVQSGVDDEIRRAAAEFDRQRTITLNQFKGVAQAIMRPTIAQLTLVGDHWVGKVTNAVNAWIIRVVGGSITLAGVIGLIVGLARSRKVVAIAGGVIAAIGLTVVLVAEPATRIGQPQITLPNGNVICQQMLELGERLREYERPIAREERNRDAAAAARAVLPAKPALRLRDALQHRKSTPEQPDPPTTKETTAAAALDAANQCITYASTSQMATLAEQTFTRALALLSDTVFCASAADCAVLGKACDAFVGVCLDWGYYCDAHGDCADRQGCDLQKHRCVDAERPCTLPADCAPEYACDRRTARCENIGEINARREACDLLDNAPNSPCRAGQVVVNPERWVECEQLGSAQSEVCDGIDNDCNRQVDEGLARPPGCPSNRGECSARGTWSCSGGSWSCTEIEPAPEQCDGLDNDCNGLVDDVGAPTGTCDAVGQGECRKGTQYCSRCVPAEPSPEVCDGLDNDCDGIHDPLPVCDEVVILSQSDSENEKELTWSPFLKTDLIDAYKTVGPVSCGTDAHGRPYHRTKIELSVYAVNGATCEATGAHGGFVDPDTTSCQIEVHAKTTQWGRNVWCSATWSGRASGAYQR